MIQNRSHLQYSQQNTIINQLKQYRKINDSLRKKLKQKDNKIQKLWGYIQDAGIQLTPQTYISKSQIPQERSYKLALSDNRKKEKQNKIQDLDLNKHPSYSLMIKSTRPDIHLPSLQRKNKNIFQQDVGIQNPEKKSKIVKISIDKLKPLNAQQVKKRFLMKYQRAEINQQVQ